MPSGNRVFCGTEILFTLYLKLCCCHYLYNVYNALVNRWGIIVEVHNLTVYYGFKVKLLFL